MIPDEQASLQMINPQAPEVAIGCNEDGALHLCLPSLVRENTAEESVSQGLAYRYQGAQPGSTKQVTPSRCRMSMYRCTPCQDGAWKSCVYVSPTLCSTIITIVGLGKAVGRVHYDLPPSCSGEELAALAKLDNPVPS